MAAFKRAGWIVNHIEGSHHILVKAGSQIHLSIPVHAGKELGIGLNSSREGCRKSVAGLDPHLFRNSA
ncbi:MAG TPA: type II toxin-antitoxin system HicA family toxin [Methanocalculus sp.]|nr:type II toxin-antitoxin system HicA family toxin [Methanocalculus sp.]HIJ06880.1 type II toxin-antitoxin system HicA family toxin [Methanocalculus sp.]